MKKIFVSDFLGLYRIVKNNLLTMKKTTDFFVYDISGKLIGSKSVVNAADGYQTYQWSTVEISSGIYYLICKSNEKTYSKTFIVNHF